MGVNVCNLCKCKLDWTKAVWNDPTLSYICGPCHDALSVHKNTSTDETNKKNNKKSTKIIATKKCGCIQIDKERFDFVSDKGIAMFTFQVGNCVECNKFWVWYPN